MKRTLGSALRIFVAVSLIGGLTATVVGWFLDDWLLVAGVISLQTGWMIVLMVPHPDAWFLPLPEVPAWSSTAEAVKALAALPTWEEQLVITEILCPKCGPIRYECEYTNPAYFIRLGMTRSEFYLAVHMTRNHANPIGAGNPDEHWSFYDD